MIYITRYLIVILFIQSCAIVQPMDTPKIIKSLIFGVDQIEVTDSFFDEMEYSFARVTIGRSASAILVLSSIDNGFYTWLGSNNERIITVDGKIIYTVGLQHNINFLDFVSFKSPGTEYTHMLELYDPSAMIEIKLIHSLSEGLIVENFNSSVIDWHGENYYYLNKLGQIRMSVQHYHPMAPKVTIDFFFK
ncbi:YjbF family lipoprotein [Gammaproteobacteria bacterium]|nr:YjbF family lipoprotein [Gammaproteobacteria bacterium]